MRRRRCGTPEASRRSSVVVVVLLQIFPGSSFIFLFLFGPTARARMFLICSRSFSLSRPPPAAGIAPPPSPPQSQESKVEKRILVTTTPHLIFPPREKSRFAFSLVTVVVVVLGSVVWSESFLVGHLFRIRTASSIRTHTHRHTHTNTRGTH